MTNGLRTAGLALAAFLVAAPAPAAQTPAYVDVAHAVAAHPLHAVLAQYDREIATLRATLNVSATGDVARRARKGAAALAQGAASARPHLDALAAHPGADDRALERDALDSITSSQSAADRAMRAFAADLARETSASLAAYGRSIGERSARALAARRQQLLERELTLAFDLARSNGGKRLALRLKLDHLHLDRTDRAHFAAELAALGARASNAVAAMRRGDAIVLADYESDLRREGAGELARMAAQLEAKAAANMELRRRVLRGGANAEPSAAQRAAQATAFAASYRPDADARAVANGLSDASADISRRFEQLAASATGSQRETIAQIRTLQTNRDALYRSMVSQIMREALAAARARGLAGVSATASQPRRSVNVTATVEKALRAF